MEAKEKQAEEKINNILGDINGKIKDVSGLFDNMLNNLIPKNVPKQIQIQIEDGTESEYNDGPPYEVIDGEPYEVIVKKGFLGFGKVIKIVQNTKTVQRKMVIKNYRTINANAYISMNNIICFDIPDKVEMKKYFDDLK